MKIFGPYHFVSSTLNHQFPVVWSLRRVNYLSEEINNNKRAVSDAINFIYKINWFTYILSISSSFLTYVTTSTIPITSTSLLLKYLSNHILNFFFLNLLFACWSPFPSGCFFLFRKYWPLEHTDTPIEKNRFCKWIRFYFSFLYSLYPFLWLLRSMRIIKFSNQLHSWFSVFFLITFFRIHHYGSY